MPRPRSLACALTGLVWLLGLTARASGADPEVPPPVRSEFSLKSGETLRSTYHFDHNALKDCLRAGDSLIALTDSGNLLRFDGANLKMTGQLVGRGYATSIGPGRGGEVLVGFADGQVATLDPVSLRLQRFAKVKGIVVWLSDYTQSPVPAAVAAVDDASGPSPWPGESIAAFGKRQDHWSKQQRPLSVAVLSSGAAKLFAVATGKDHFPPNAFLLDDSGRLWMGTDKGEFGGDCSYMDLRTGKVSVVTAECAGVLGFLRVIDGRRLVYGGTSHLGMRSGYIAHVESGRWERLVEFESNDWSEEKGSRDASAATPPNMPQGPVDLIGEDAAGKGFWVVSEHDLYHASTGFSKWSKVCGIGGRWIGGRRASMGNTPTVNAMLPSLTNAADLLFALGRDGLAKVSGGQVSLVRLPGQLESDETQGIADIWPTSLGTLFVSAGWSDHYAWRLEGDLWRRLSFFPDRDCSDASSSWHTAVPLADLGDGVLAFCGDSHSNGERVLTKLTVRGVSELRRLDPDPGCDDDGFFTAAGRMVRCAAGSELNVLEEGRYRQAGVADGLLDGYPDPHGRPSVALGKAGPVEFFHYVPQGQLLRLGAGPDGKLRVEPVAYPGAKPGPIFDASVESPQRFLLAAVRGLFRLHAEDGRLEAIASPEPTDGVQSLCPDTQGRLWAAGDQLHLSSDGGQHWELVDLPMLSPSRVKRIRPDPQNPRGMILSLFDRGVVFLEW